MHKLFILLIRSFLTYFLISFLCCDPAVGQSQKFIEVIPGNAIPDNSEMSAYITRLKKNPNISNHHFIHLNPIATAQKEGILTLEIPGKAKPIIAEASEVRYYSSADYEWIGKTDENRGTIIIQIYDDQPGDSFRILPKSDSYLQINSLNMATGEISGEFKFTMVVYGIKDDSSLPDTLRFTNGRFHTKILERSRRNRHL